MTSRMHALPQLALSALLLVGWWPAASADPLIAGRVHEGTSALQNLVADATFTVEISLHCNQTVIGEYTVFIEFDENSLDYVSATNLVGDHIEVFGVGDQIGETRVAAFSADAASTVTTGLLFRVQYKVLAGATDNTLTFDEANCGVTGLSPILPLSPILLDDRFLSADPIECPGQPTAVDHWSLQE